VIESDEGFSVEVLERVGMLYREGDKSILIDSEVVTGPTVLMNSRSIREWKTSVGMQSRLVC
jgi:hypothetical protein